MGVDCQLLVNSKHGVKQIETLVKEGFGLKITQADYKGDHSFLTIEHGEDLRTWLYIAPSTEYGGLDGTILSCRLSDHNLALLKRIAKVLGGFLCESDCNNEYEAFSDPHQGNARFILDHTILVKAIDKSSELADKVGEAIGYK